MIHLCCILRLEFSWIDTLHFITEILITFDASSAYLEVFDMATIVVLCYIVKT